MSAGGVSIVVPTYRECPNLPPLVERATRAVEGLGLPFEIILIDDNSNDGTLQAAGELASRFPVRLIVRTQERGLSSAVLRGFAEARYDRLVVLDADLQHPPEAIPELVRALDRPGCDFAIATRYGEGGGIDERWPVARRWISRTATLLARPLAPLSDPMSGFFALHTDSWRQAARLDPIGYKIALELYVKCGCRRPVEVPIRFAPRHAGRSKLNMAEQLRYLRHLWRLYGFRYPMLRATAVVLVLAVIAGAVIWLFQRIGHQA